MGSLWKWSKVKVNNESMDHYFQINSAVLSFVIFIDKVYYVRAIPFEKLVEVSYLCFRKCHRWPKNNFYRREPVLKAEVTYITTCWFMRWSMTPLITFKWKLPLWCIMVYTGITDKCLWNIFRGVFIGGLATVYRFRNMPSTGYRISKTAWLQSTVLLCCPLQSTSKKLTSFYSLRVLK